MTDTAERERLMAAADALHQAFQRFRPDRFSRSADARQRWEWLESAAQTYINARVDVARMQAKNRNSAEPSGEGSDDGSI